MSVPPSIVSRLPRFVFCWRSLASGTNGFDCCNLLNRRCFTDLFNACFSTCILFHWRETFSVRFLLHLDVGFWFMNDDVVRHLQSRTVLSGFIIFHHDFYLNTENTLSQEYVSG